MKVLMMSTDRKILEAGTQARSRMQSYAELFDELHIVVLGAKGERKSAGKLSLYPLSRVSALFWKPPQADVVTSQDPFETALIARFVARKISAPLHVQIHTDFKSPYFRSGALNRVRALLAPWNLRKAKTIRVVSERIKRSLPAGVIGKASVLPIFADVESIRRSQVPVGLKQESFSFGKVVLMASRFTKEKDIATAIEAFARAASAYPDAGLVVVGEGPEKDALVEKAKSLGIENKTVFVSWTDKEKLASYMKVADAFLSTSLFEGYGLSMLEAHAAGCALVATDAGIAPELTSYICDPRNALCLSERLKEALFGKNGNKAYEYPYASPEAYFEAFKADIERALL